MRVWVEPSALDELDSSSTAFGVSVGSVGTSDRERARLGDRVLRVGPLRGVLEGQHNLLFRDTGLDKLLGDQRIGVILLQPNLSIFQTDVDDRGSQAIIALSVRSASSQIHLAHCSLMRSSFSRASSVSFWLTTLLPSWSSS